MYCLKLYTYLWKEIDYGDYENYKGKTAIGKERIAKHLGNMLGGTIAVITSVLVVEVNLEPKSAAYAAGKSYFLEIVNQ